MTAPRISSVSDLSTFECVETVQVGNYGRAYVLRGLVKRAVGLVSVYGWRASAITPNGISADTHSRETYDNPYQAREAARKAARELNDEVGRKLLRSRRW